MIDVDIDRFWSDDEAAHRDNCFSPEAPQVALGIRMSDECVFAELDEPGEPWGHTPRERRIELNKRYNEKALRIVGRRLLAEEFPPEDAAFPPCRQIGEVFGGEYVFDGRTTWLKGHMETPADLERKLDEIDRMDLEAFIFPPQWDREKDRIFNAYGLRPAPFRAVRGPVTLATSVFGTENLIFLLYDDPELAVRFRDAITRVLLEYARLFAREAGYDWDASRPKGFCFLDDDCCLLTPEMYERFGYPVLKSVFDAVAPDPGDMRYQHSDSAMGHLLPLLARLNLTACNFGPTVMIDEIRRHMPRTRIEGQLAPFTFMSNDERAIVGEVRRDCVLARENGRGVSLTTAGSINNGSLLTSMRAVMAAIQRYGRYT